MRLGRRVTKYSGTVARGENDRPTAVNALVYAFYALLALVVIVFVLWLFDVVPGWVVPLALALTALVFALLWRGLNRYRRTLSSGSPSETPQA